MRYLPALAAVFLAAPALASTAVAGRVVDAATGRPVPQVFVRVQGGLASAFSGPDGRFTLPADAGGNLVLSASGYQLRVVTRAELARPVALTALTPFSAQAPRDGARPVPTPNPHALTGHLGLDYGVSSVLQRGSNGAQLSGVSTNALRLVGEAHAGRLFAGGELGHARTPIDVGGLSKQENPAYSPESWTFEGRVGYRFPLGRLGAVPALAYRLLRYDPMNGQVPYSNTPLDFKQTTQSLGLALDLHDPLPLGFEATAKLRLYPLSLGSADPGDPVLQPRLGTSGELVITHAFGRLSPALGYRYERWQSDGLDSQTQLLFARVALGGEEDTP